MLLDDVVPGKRLSCAGRLPEGRFLSLIPFLGVRLDPATSSSSSLGNRHISICEVLLFLNSKEKAIGIIGNVVKNGAYYQPRRKLVRKVPFDISILR